MASPIEKTVPQPASLVDTPDAAALVDPRTDEDHAEPRTIRASRRPPHLSGVAPGGDAAFERLASGTAAEPQPLLAGDPDRPAGIGRVRGPARRIPA